MSLAFETSVWERIISPLYKFKQGLTYHTHPTGRASLALLGELRNCHQGKRCFILGNGPSLQKTDLTRLRDEYTFGLNRIYMLFPQLGFSTTFLVTVNHLVVEQCVDEILAVPSLKFLPWSLRKIIKPPLHSNTVLFRTDRSRGGFTTDARQPLWQGATVTFVAMQLAFHMGFEQVILVGVDHSFVTQGKPHTEVVSQGDDPNHFSPDYFGKGFRWQLPDLETSEIAYRLARKTFESSGCEILDATIGGKLTIFPKVDYLSLFR
jgi:hypothetical protein